MEVSDVLRDRMSEPSGLQRMVMLSLLVHTAVAGALFVMPRAWLGSEPSRPRTVMTISLTGGNGGPSNGGMTSIGGRAVQAEPPPEPPKRPEPVRPPAAMTETTVPIPTKAPPPRPARPAPARPEVKSAPDDARGRTPTRGPELRQGSAIAETGARGLGFGLSTSSGTGTGSTLDVADFCCPDYIALMVEKVRTNWNARVGIQGMTIIKYTIQRDGTISGAEITKRSGYSDLDINALRAVVGARQFLPLPAQFPNSTLTVNLNFEYTR